MPSLVHEVGVGGDTVNLNAHLLQLLVVVCEVAELGRADEGEVAWVEEEDGPLAEDVVLADLGELAVVENRVLEIQNLSVDQRHMNFLPALSLELSALW